MISNPMVGDKVLIRYKKSLKSWFPLEGKTGTITIVCKARRCRNHGVIVNGQFYAIPCGNLFPLPKPTAAMAIDAPVMQMELFS